MQLLVAISKYEMKQVLARLTHHLRLIYLFRHGSPSPQRSKKPLADLPQDHISAFHF
jgi:hypothetical protein